MNLMKRSNNSDFIINDKVLKQLYTKLCGYCSSSALMESNSIRGSINEQHDYVQDTLVTLIQKLKANKVSFNSFSALWSWCTCTLGWRLMRSHRDYTMVKAKTGWTTDLQGESESGAKIEDLASSLHVDLTKLPDAVCQDSEYKDFVVAYSGTNAQIVKAYEMYTVDASCTLLSLSAIMNSLKAYGVREGFEELNIPKDAIPAITDAILDLLDMKPKDVKTVPVAKQTCLGSRDRAYLKQVHATSCTNSMISISELENALCSNNK